MRLDHLAIAAETLEEGVAWAEDQFKTTFLPGGKHARFGTHNQLLGLEDDIYLEVITVDPDAHCDGPRWFNLDAFKGPPRLVNWICEPDNFETALAHGMRSVEMERGDLRWTMGAPPDGSLPLGGGYPTLLQWHTDIPPGVGLPSSGWTLDRLTIAHPQADMIATSLRDTLRDTRIRFELEPDIRLSADFSAENGRIVSI